MDDLLLAQPTTPQRANNEPYLQGTGAPRHYPHTFRVRINILLNRRQSRQFWNILLNSI
jgi:hypothetical protein